MPFYRPASGPIGGGRGADEDAVEGANQVVDNLIDTLYPNTDDGGAGQAAAKAFHDAAYGSIPKDLLPDIEVTDATSAVGTDSGDLGGGLNSIMKNLTDMAANLGDPFGVLNAIITFLVSVFTEGAKQIGTLAMSAGEMYQQAAAAAADGTKKLLEEGSSDAT